MASKQAVDFADSFAEVGRQSSNPSFELETIRDVTENPHLATTKEPGRADEVDRTIGEMGTWLRSTLGLQTAVA
jgi:hypothetical protein